MGRADVNDETSEETPIAALWYRREQSGAAFPVLSNSNRTPAASTAALRQCCWGRDYFPRGFALPVPTPSMRHRPQTARWNQPEQRQRIGKDEHVERREHPDWQRPKDHLIDPPHDQRRAQINQRPTRPQDDGGAADDIAAARLIWAIMPYLTNGSGHGMLLPVDRERQDGPRQTAQTNPPDDGSRVGSCFPRRRRLLPLSRRTSLA
jgi:hypothetical protein